jgi:hypothetical protein
MKMSVEQVVELLRPLVKMSNVKNQAHIDLTLAPADKLDMYKQALVAAKLLVQEKVISQAELSEKLGL